MKLHLALETYFRLTTIALAITPTVLFYYVSGVDPLITSAIWTVYRVFAHGFLVSLIP